MGYRFDADFKRMSALPRRSPPSTVEMEGFIPDAHLLYRKPGGGKQVNHTGKPVGIGYGLWGIQAYALNEMRRNNGAVLSLQVGAGKSLISMLAGSALKAKRPLVVVPGGAILDKTVKQVLPEALEGWDFVEPIIKSYAWFSNKKNHGALFDLMPDAIILDEAHRLSGKSARRKRFDHYIRKHSPKVVAMSGTLLDVGIRRAAHILKWCLGEGSPYPITWRGIDQLARAIDKDGDPRNSIGLGDLYKLGMDPLDWLASRFVETPGVVTMQDSALKWDGNIVFDVDKTKPNLSTKQRASIEDVKESWIDPDGMPVMSHLHMHRIQRQLSLGFFYRWKEQPPRAWKMARYQWRKHVQEVTRRSTKLLTEAQVRGVAINQEQPDWLAWKAVKDTFELETVPVWIDRGPVEEMAQWAIDNNGIVWIEHAAIGAALTEMGVPYNPKMSKVEQGKPVAFSIQGRGEGLDMPGWSQNLLPSIPGNARVLEQLIGRTCRNKQEASEVNFEVWASTKALHESFERVLEKTKRIEKGSKMNKKLNKAIIRIKKNGT